MRRILALLSAFILLVLPLTGSAAEGGTPLSVSPVAETVRPGRAMIISFTAPEAGTAEICLQDTHGNDISVVMHEYECVPGLNQVWWNGTYGGVPAPEGSYRLVVTLDGVSADTPVTVGPMAPYLANIVAENTAVTPDTPLRLSCYAGCGGRLTIGLIRDGDWMQQASWQVSEGDCSVTWTPVSADDGDAVFTLRLTDDLGDSSTEEHIAITLQGFENAAAAGSIVVEETVVLEDDEPETDPEDSETAWQETVKNWQGDEGDDEVIVLPDTDEPAAGAEDSESAAEGDHESNDAESAAVQAVIDQRAFTPSYTSPYAARPSENGSFWTLPMDINDTEAVWNMLTAPVTTLYDGSKAKDKEKRQIVVHASPSESSPGVGVVTNLTQGVRVLEKGDTWTLIECYSSSFHDSKVLAWNMLVQGYVPTKYLRTVTPNQHMGIVIDKLTQRLYLFIDGELYDTLLCSTGLANERQPYNETRSGEFLLQNPAVGAFRSDSLVCSYGIRFNGGDLLHEVPHTENSDGTNNYKTTEPKLGTKCSHGCIRVQRLKTPKGTNMLWLWEHRKDETKIVIWEDWQGRQISYPDDDTTLYYNPNGGSYYHTAETCYSAKGKTFSPFTYGELDTGSFAKLTRCPNCAGPLRKAEIDAINLEHAPGGDHDPVLTAARQKFMDKLNKQLAE